MKGRHVGFALCLGALVVQASIVTAPAADFTCQVYGDSFVLDDADFAAMARGSSITREKFAALPPNSEIRVAVCDSRKIWRLVKAGKADSCAVDRYPNYAAKYFGPSELQPAIAAIAKTIAKGCPKQ
jgi:hypothetical protein